MCEQRLEKHPNNPGGGQFRPLTTGFTARLLQITEKNVEKIKKKRNILINTATPRIPYDSLPWKSHKRPSRCSPSEFWTKVSPQWNTWGGAPPPRCFPSGQAAPVRTLLQLKQRSSQWTKCDAFPGFSSGNISDVMSVMVLFQ